ncbi:MAG: hypothetical protein ACI85J_001059 [Candidatus Poriferisodalaceae bacterium]|jgi:hypothetical protein|tara:strand:- start:597 stop:779 length:183 start_codon:yes stop_codon:yes gene_type:complete
MYSGALGQLSFRWRLSILANREGLLPDAIEKSLRRMISYSGYLLQALSDNSQCNICNDAY